MKPIIDKIRANNTKFYPDTNDFRILNSEFNAAEFWSQYCAFTSFREYSDSIELRRYSRFNAHHYLFLQLTTNRAIVPFLMGRKVRTAQSDAPVNRRVPIYREQKVPQKITFCLWADKGENVR